MKPLCCEQCQHPFSGEELINDDELLCPECGHSHEVEPDYTDHGSEKVEKFYPGEKKDANLDRFGSATQDQSSSQTEKPINTQVQPEVIETPDIESVAKAPFRLLALLFAILVFGLGFYLIIFEHHPEGVIFSLSNQKRLILAALLSLLGSIFIYSSFRSRKPLLLTTAALLSASLCYFPYHFKDHFIKERMLANLLEKGHQAPVNTEEISTPEVQTFATLIHYHKLAELQQLYPLKSSQALLLKNVPQIYLTDLEAYLQDSLPECHEISLTPSLQLIDGSPAVFVVIIHDEPYTAQVTSALSILGDNFTQHEELPLKLGYIHPHVISGELPEDTSKHPIIFKFEQVTLDLIHLNRHRQEKALLSVQNAERLVYAPEILAQLSIIIHTRDSEFQEFVLEAMENWIDLTKIHEGAPLNLDPLIDHAKQQAVASADALLAKGKPVPQHYIKFFIKNKVKNGAPILHKMWLKAPHLNETLYLRSGKFAKSELEADLSGYSKKHTTSACNILTFIGDADSIEPLRKLRESTTDKKIQLSITTTIDAIENRL